MGQKIHPLGFRVGITKKHQSQWFARFHKHQYAQTILEDHLLRQTLSKLLPEILQKQLNNSKNSLSSDGLNPNNAKNEKSMSQVPKISHIKIERGLIPYEICIQIYAQNCELLKSAVDKIEIQPSLAHNFLKNQLVLEKASAAYGQKYLNTTKKNGDETSFEISSNNEKQQGLLNRKKTSQKKFGKPQLLAKRLKKRQTILQRFRERFLKNMILVKKGNKITRKLQKDELMLKRRRKNKSQFSISVSKRISTKEYLNSNTNLIFNKSAKYSQKITKFVNIFMSKMNRDFLNLLKTQMKDWDSYLKNHKDQQLQKYGILRYAPLGYQKKWSLTRLQRLKNQPLHFLMKLLKSLQKRALQKMEVLRQDFIILGTLSTSKSFAYFQRIRFIKGLRELIQQIKMEQSPLFQQKSSSSFAKMSHSNNRIGLESNRQIQRKFEKSLESLTDKALAKKFSNLKEENRKIKFIDYLQDIVQKHRHQNIYLYLATISDSLKYLKKIKQFTKQQANFLYGVNLQTLNHKQGENGSLESDSQKTRSFVKSQVLKAVNQANRKNDLQKNLQDVFIEQLQKQKTISKQNIQLIPKISLKFYSVKSQNLETKASFVADSIVDDLEKRKAFRRVIKKAKEDLMKTSKVKGVKIQVSGRLNGAEIARSEWVRAGRVPLQTLRANIDYCYKTAQTIYGIIGVKVWIYKGYTKTSNVSNTRVNPTFANL